MYLHIELQGLKATSRRPLIVNGETYTYLNRYGCYFLHSKARELRFVRWLEN